MERDVPKSRVRRRPAYTPPPRQSPKKRHSPPWVGGLMAACFLLGITWLAIFYVTGGSLIGLRSLGNYNLIVGFALILGGFLLATRWR
jgi:polyferredoxin